jgi:hypothetical protein
MMKQYLKALALAVAYHALKPKEVALHGVLSKAQPNWRNN